MVFLLADLPLRDRRHASPGATRQQEPQEGPEDHAEEQEKDGKEPETTEEPAAATGEEAKASMKTPVAVTVIDQETMDRERAEVLRGPRWSFGMPRDYGFGISKRF
jgi:hypothetical protein